MVWHLDSSKSLRLIGKYKNMERELTFELQPPVSYFIHCDWFLTVLNQIELIRTDVTKRKPISKAENYDG
jgi:hypothetical protein